MGFLHDLVFQKVTKHFLGCICSYPQQKGWWNTQLCLTGTATPNLCTRIISHRMETGQFLKEYVIFWTPNNGQVQKWTNLMCNIPSVGQYKTEKLQSFTHFNILIEKVTIWIKPITNYPNINSVHINVVAFF
jgi:hypothetical protein